MILDLRGNNRKVYTSRAAVKRVEGPAGTGKSLAIMAAYHTICEHFPGARMLIVRDTRVSLNSTIIPQYLGMIGRGHPCHTDAQPESIQSFRYPNGSVIVLGGLDKPDRFMGADYDHIWINEGTVGVNQGDVDLLSTRFRGPKRTPFRQLTIDCNPSHPSHWLNTWPAGEGHVRIRTSHEDNPLLFDGGEWTDEGLKYLARLDDIADKAKRQRMRYGVWAASEGAIFSISEDVHNVRINDFANLYDAYPAIVGLDWGISDPFAAPLLLVDAANKAVYMTAECYMAGLSTRDQCQMVAQMLATGRSQYKVDKDFDWGRLETGIKPRAIYYDPAMNNRGPRGSDGAYGEPPIVQFKAKMKGFVAGDNRDRLQNLEYLQSMTRASADRLPGEWKLYISKEECPNAWREFEGAAWKKDERTGQFYEDTDDPDHIVTATYYALRRHLPLVRPETGLDRRINELQAVS